MSLKFVGLIIAVGLLYSNLSAFNYVFEKSGAKHKCEVITDNNDNEILFANTSTGPVLIPFSELIKLEVVKEDESSYDLNVTYKDNSKEIVSVDNSLSIMCKQGIGKILLSDISYVSFIEETESADNIQQAPAVTQQDVAVTNVEDSNIEVAEINQIQNDDNNKIVEESVKESVLSDNTPIINTQDETNELSKDSAIVSESEGKSVVENPILSENITAPYVEPVNNEVAEVAETQKVEDNATAVESVTNVEESAIYNENNDKLLNNVSDRTKDDENVENDNASTDKIEGSSKSDKPIQQTKYQIKKYDTLWDLAQKFYHNPFLWKSIYEDNLYINNPDLIYPGDILIVNGIDAVYTNGSSIGYNDNMANNRMGIDNRVVVFNNNKDGLFALRNVTMFTQEIVKKKVEKDSSDYTNEEVVKLLEEERFTKMFSYDYFSKLGEIVPKFYEGEGEVTSRNSKDEAFIKFYSSVRINLGNNNGVKVNDKYVIFDLIDELGEEGVPAYMRKKGEIQISKVFTSYSVGTVTRYFGQGLIKQNDKVFKKKMLEIPKIKKLSLERKDISCRVVSPVREMGKAITQASDMFIVDKGLRNNLEVGQVFEIFINKEDGYSDLPVGEAYVVKTFDNYSVIQLDSRWSEIKLKKGDFLQHKLSFEIYK